MLVAVLLLHEGAALQLPLHEVELVDLVVGPRGLWPRGRSGDDRRAGAECAGHLRRSVEVDLSVVGDRVVGSLEGGVADGENLVLDLLDRRAIGRPSTGLALLVRLLLLAAAIPAGGSGLPGLLLLPPAVPILKLHLGLSGHHDQVLSPA